MVATDHAELAEKFHAIPDCVDPHNESEFNIQLLQSVRRAAITANDNDPEHRFLIGLAYLDGIDVETDRARGIGMITEAAEADLPEAMKKLWNIYRMGDGCAPDYAKEHYWAKRLVGYCIDKYGDESLETLDAVHMLAQTLTYSNPEYAKKFSEVVYEGRVKLLGETHPDTLDALRWLASGYFSLNDYTKSRELTEQLYVLQCATLGEEHRDAINTLTTLITFSECFEHDEDKTIELMEKMCELCEKAYGKNYSETAKWLRILNFEYEKRGDEDNRQRIAQKLEMIEISKRAEGFFDGQKRVAMLEDLLEALKDKEKLPEALKSIYEYASAKFGEEDEFSVDTLHMLADAYEDNWDFSEAVQLRELLFTVNSKLHGEKSEQARAELAKIGELYKQTEELDKAEAAFDKLCELEVGELSKWDSSNGVDGLKDVAFEYSYIPNGKEKALATNEKAYAHLCILKGAECSQAKSLLLDIADCHLNAGNTENALLRFEQLHESYKTSEGEAAYETLETKWKIAKCLSKMGESEKAAAVAENAYEVELRHCGEENAIFGLEKLIRFYKEVANYARAAELYETLCARKIKTDGENDISTLEAIRDMAYCYGESGNREKAIQLCTEAHARFAAEWGQAHRSTLVYLMHLAYHYREKGDLKKAEELYTKRFALQCANPVIGENDPDAVSSLAGLAGTYVKMNRLEEAEELYLKVYTKRCSLLGETDVLTLRAKKELESVRSILKEREN